MRIPLDNKHTLVTDENCCWIVTTIESENKKPYDKRVSGYYATLGQAVASYIDKRINSLESAEIKQLAEAVEELKAEVRAWKLELAKLQ